MVRWPSKNVNSGSQTQSGASVWHYVFFVEFKGHVEDAAVQKAIGDMKKYCLLWTSCGSFPDARPT
jgi:prephenate dehydratase